MMMPKRSIRKTVLVPLSLTFLVLISTFLYSGFKIRQHNATHAVQHRYEGVQFLLGELQANQVDMMLSTLELISHDQSLQASLLTADQTALLATATPIFQQLHQRHGITHFYFISPDQSVLLRAHQPDQFGDRVDRHTMRQAAASGLPAHGLELGPLGTLTLRVVYPWHIEDRLIGYLELGQEIDHLLQTLRTITQIEFLLTIDKSLLQQEQWEAGMRMLMRQPDWDLFSDRVVIDQSIPLPTEVIKALPCDKHSCKKPHRTIDFDGRHYLARSFGFKDAGGSEVGSFVLLQDMSGEAQAFRKFFFTISAFSLLICSGLFSFAFSILGRVDRKLDETQRQLHDEIDKATASYQLLEVEIAERKHAEEELKNLNESLEARVDQRTSELVELSQELNQAYSDLKAKQATILHQDKMACIGQLAAGVAHDINNPIGFVANNLSELETSTADLVDFIATQNQALQAAGNAALLKKVEEKRQQLNLDYILEDLPAMIHESLEGTERVSQIVKNLRTFSRADDVDSRLADLHGCLDSTINLTSNELRYKAMVVRNYGTLPPVRCYPQQLNQVFMNLLINAAHAIEKQGEITIKTWTEGADALIAIADNGAGIPPEHRDKIFEPFYTTKELGKGTGLGLSITLDIIQRHYGKITFESEMGRGTTFLIRLPIDGEPHV